MVLDGSSAEAPRGDDLELETRDEIQRFYAYFRGLRTISDFIFFLTQKRSDFRYFLLVRAIGE